MELLLNNYPIDFSKRAWISLDGGRSRILIRVVDITYWLTLWPEGIETLEFLKSFEPTSCRRVKDAMIKANLTWIEIKKSQGSNA